LVNHQVRVVFAPENNFCLELLHLDLALEDVHDRVDNVFNQAVAVQAELKVLSFNQVIVQVVFDLVQHDLGRVCHDLQIVGYRHVAVLLPPQQINYAHDALERRQHFVAHTGAHQIQQSVLLAELRIVFPHRYVAHGQHSALTRPKDQVLDAEVHDVFLVQRGGVLEVVVRASRWGHDFSYEILDAGAHLILLVLQQLRN
jgi:hypothetical protein